jgi:hypothetical protein
MEIHRPKPWQGARELLKEVGIIVVGVLIALGGEQIVQSFDRRIEANEARQMLRSEMASNAGDASVGLAQQPCLNALFDRFVAWANGGPHVPTAKSGMFFYEPHTSAWEAVKAGAAAYMPLEERFGYTRFYDSAHYVTVNSDLAIPLLLRIGGQTAKPALAPADAQHMPEDIGTLRVILAVRTNNMLKMVRAARAMGVGPAPMSAETRANLEALCTSVGVKPTLPTQ